LEGIRICRKGFPNRTLHADYVERYALLGAIESKSSPDPKQCAIKMLDRLVKEGSMKEEMFRIGLTKVFFKAGVLAHLEDLRDERLAFLITGLQAERLAFLITGLQAQIRWYCKAIDLKERRDLLAATKVIQYNVADWVHVMNWPWLLLFLNTMPLVRESKMEETMQQLKTDIEEFDRRLAGKKNERNELEQQLQKAIAEKGEILEAIKSSRSENTEAEDQIDRLTEQKEIMEKDLSETNAKLDVEQKKTAQEAEALKKIEETIGNMKKSVQDVELGKRKSAAEKAAKENQIRSLQDEVSQQQQTVVKLNKERKLQEEEAKKLTDEMNAQKERNEQNNRTKAKLEETLQDREVELESEKRNRADADKAKRKTEGDLRVRQETLEEIGNEKRDLETVLRKKDNELHAISTKLEDQQVVFARLSKQLKDDEAKLAADEGEIENERAAREKSDRARAEIQKEVIEMSARLEEQKNATATQIEAGKRQEAEIAKLRRELEENRLSNESTETSLRKKNSEGLAQLNDQIYSMRKMKIKAEKERAEKQKRLDEANAQLDILMKAKAEQERATKSLEEQANELQQSSEEHARKLQELTSLRNRTLNENNELVHRVEELEQQINAVSTTKAQVAQQLEATKRLADEEQKEKQTLASHTRNLQMEVNHLRATVEDEVSAKGDLLRQLSKANTEIEQWKAKFQDASFMPTEALEDLMKKHASKMLELEEALDAANSKVGALEKIKSQLALDADEAHKEAERHAAIVEQMEKKQKAFEKVVGEWKRKVDDASNQLDVAQKECRTASADLFKEQSLNDNLNSQAEGIRRENEIVSRQIRELQAQLADGVKSVHEISARVRRLETEKDELQRALDEAEATLEAEETKVTRSQIELGQIREEIEKRFQEKEEEFVNIRKNHQRSLESVQVATEIERKHKGELQKIKKKLESDVSDLETALLHANAANEDAQRNIARYSEQISELQTVLEEEQQRREQFRVDFIASEKRLATAQAEKEELSTRLLQMERAKKQTESESNDARVQLDALVVQEADLSEIKKRADIDETYTELTASEERSKSATLEAARLAEQLQQAQEKSQIAERERRTLEANIKELQAKIDETETAKLRSGQREISKLEHRMASLTSELEGEQRRYQDTMKTIKKQDRRIRELEFQVDEDKKRFTQMQETVDKLQSKIKSQKKLLDEAEEAANLHLRKFRSVSIAARNAEERAETAENGLQKIRSKAKLNLEAKHDNESGEASTH
uniref:Myosin motor domain-containing protein n=1 Tax=Toxocara canis TaxID=6265 RepID=A0A183TYJ1_TOXCA